MQSIFMSVPDTHTAFHREISSILLLSGIVCYSMQLAIPLHCIIFSFLPHRRQTLCGSEGSLSRALCRMQVRYIQFQATL